MSDNIIQQIIKIEAEADRIVAQAEQNARKLEDSLKAKTGELRAEREESLRKEMEGFEGGLRVEADRAEQELQQRARQATQRLEHLDEKAREEAVQFVLKRLRGGQPWP